VWLLQQTLKWISILVRRWRVFTNPVTNLAITKKQLPKKQLSDLFPVIFSAYALVTFVPIATYMRMQVFM